MKSLLKLLKEYNFKTIEEYQSMVFESYVNGNYSQAKEQFNALDKSQQKAFIQNYLLVDCNVHAQSREFKFFFSLL